MVTIEQAQRGITRFVDAEMMPKLTGIQKWAVGAVCALYANKLNEVVDTLNDKPMIAVLDIIGDNNCIDIDALYTALRPQADRTTATIDIPIIGSMTFGSQDIDNLYRYIRES